MLKIRTNLRKLRWEKESNNIFGFLHLKPILLLSATEGTLVLVAQFLP